MSASSYEASSCRDRQTDLMKILILAFSLWSCGAVMEPCLRPLLENGFFVPHSDVYAHGVSISYGCYVGLKPALGTGAARITCSHGGWSHTPECIDATSCPAPSVPNARPAHPPAAFYPHASFLPFVCDRGFAFNGTDSAFCLNAIWSLPVCKRKPYTCDSPARVFDSAIVNLKPDVFEHGVVLRYVCAEPFEQAAIEYMFCQCGVWSAGYSCDRSLIILDEYTMLSHLLHSKDSCDAERPESRRSHNEVRRCEAEPHIENGHSHQLKGGMRHSVECWPLYKLEGPRDIWCINGKWSELPVCRPPCKLNRLLIDPSHPEEYLEEGEEKRFYCRGCTRERSVVCTGGTAVYGECTAIQT